MSIDLPNWDVLPDLVDDAVIKLPELTPEVEKPEKVLREWCEIANFMYAQRGYWTSVFAERYLISKRNNHVSFRPGFVVDAEGSPDFHQIYGTLKRIVVAPPIGSLAVGQGPVRYEPFIELESPVDITDAEPMTASSDQFIRVPLLPNNVELNLHL